MAGNSTASDLGTGLSGDAWATLVGAVVGAVIAGLVAWLIQRANAKQAAELLKTQLEHQARVSYYQVEWPWYREVLHHVAAASRGAQHAMNGTNTPEIGRRTSDSLSFLHTALEVFTRTNVPASYAVGAVIHAAFEATKPGVRSPEEKAALNKQLEDTSKRLSRILVKTAGIEPSLFVEEMLADEATKNQAAS